MAYSPFLSDLSLRRLFIISNDSYQFFVQTDPQPFFISQRKVVIDSIVDYLNNPANEEKTLYKDIIHTINH